MRKKLKKERKPKKLHPTHQQRITCGKCKKVGHNRRTCGKTISTKTLTAPSPPQFKNVPPTLPTSLKSESSFTQVEQNLKGWVGSWQKVGTVPTTVPPHIAEHYHSNSHKNPNNALLPSAVPPYHTPIPEGCVRYFHQTSIENVESITHRGLLASKGQIRKGGVWVSEYIFYGDVPNLAVIELALPENGEWEENMFITNDIAKEYFVAVHLPKPATSNN